MQGDPIEFLFCNGSRWVNIKDWLSWKIFGSVPENVTEVILLALLLLIEVKILVKVPELSVLEDLFKETI